MPQLQTVCLRHIAGAIVALMILSSSTTLFAQQDSGTPRPVFDETFLHWPTQLKINGRVIVNNDVTDFDSVERQLRQVLRGKTVAFMTAGDALGEQMKSMADKKNFSSPKAETAELQSALEDAKNIYLPANSFSASDCIELKDQFILFIERGGNLIVDGAIAEALGSMRTDGTPGMNLIPDCWLDASFDGSEASKQKLAEGIARKARTVGIGIEKKTLLTISGRRLFAFGDGSATVAIAANETEPADFQKIDAQRSRSRLPMVDLTQWRRRAIDRSLAPFPPKKPKTPVVEKGSLYIVGGGGMPQGLMTQMIKEAGGVENAKCVYIPCSESANVNERQRTVTMWKRMGVKHATFIHTKDRNKSNTDEEFLAPLKDATMLWFGGGRQWNFADSYYGTKAHKLMKDVLHRGGVIGGSSAGASIQGRFLARATPIGNANILAPGYIRGGLGFLSGVAIDQHFSQRGRQKDMTQLVDKYPQMLGIGIDETTAIVVRKSRAEVVGAGKVFFYNRNIAVEEGKPDYTAVAAGGVYDLLKREVINDAEEAE